jgi:hypothetical protein
VRVSEREEFGAFVDRSSDGLLRAGWLLTGDWHTAHDLVQSALAATWTHWSNVTRTGAGAAGAGPAEAPTALLPEPVDEADHFDQADLRNTLLDAGIKTGYPVGITGVSATDIYFIADVGCEGYQSDALARYRPASGLVATLLGSSVGGGTVLSARTFGDD